MVAALQHDRERRILGSLRVGAIATGLGRWRGGSPAGQRQGGGSHTMPQKNQRTGSLRTDYTGGHSARAGRSRSPWSSASAAVAQQPSFDQIGTRGVTAGLRLQKEMGEVLSNIGCEWFARAASQVELALRLPDKLTAARSAPEAVSAYQEWLSEWMSKCGEDSFHIVSDSQRIINAGARWFADGGSAGTS